MVAHERNPRLSHHEVIGVISQEKINTSVHQYSRVVDVHQHLQGDFHLHLAGRGQVLKSDASEVPGFGVGRRNAVDQPILAVLVCLLPERRCGVLRRGEPVDLLVGPLPRAQVEGLDLRRANGNVVLACCHPTLSRFFASA